MCMLNTTGESAGGGNEVMDNRCEGCEGLKGKRLVKSRKKGEQPLGREGEGRGAEGRRGRGGESERIGKGGCGLRGLVKTEAKREGKRRDGDRR